jgi:hypothetical protein
LAALTMRAVSVARGVSDAAGSEQEIAATSATMVIIFFMR